MVQNVLGAVAELKGKKAGLLSRSRSTVEDSESMPPQETPAAFEASFGADEPAAAAPVAETVAEPVQMAPIAETPPQVVQAEPAKSDYIDFGVMTEPVAEPVAAPKVAEPVAEPAVEPLAVAAP